jgi:CelD/BcsL family acetyltransferase involved in cellulose biosynthesis
MRWTLHQIGEFDSLAAHWDTLNKSSINQSILDSQFIKSCLTHFSQGNEVIALCQDSTGPLAIGVFHKIGFGHYQTFQPSQAPLGLWLVRDNQFNTSLIDGLKKILPGVVFLIDFLQQDTTKINLTGLTNVHTSDYITTGKLDIPTDYQDFFEHLGKNMRQNHNKINNRCTKNNIELSVKLITQSQKMHEAIDHFARFESSGWKGAQGTAVNLNNNQGKFYLELLSNYAQQGLAEAWYYMVDQQVVAADLCIKSNNTLIILKTAYNEDFKKLSPALQLKFEIFKHHSQQQTPIETVEFFGKAMEWHKRFQSQLRSIEHYTWCSNWLFAAIYRQLRS